MIYFPDHFTVA